MRIRELMQVQVATARPDDRLSVAAQQMVWGGIRHLPVVDDERVVGVLSQRDVLAHQADGPGTLVVEAMSQPAHVAHPEDDEVEVAARLGDQRLGCLPVVEEGRLVGLVTTTDLIVAQVRRAFQGPARQQWIARDLMTRDPATVFLDDLLFDAAARMTTRSVRHLPVIDGDHRVVAMLSDTDLRTEMGDLASVLDDDSVRLRLRVERVKDLGLGRALVVAEETPVTEVARILVDQRVGAVPVVDADLHLVGIVSSTDLLRLLETPASVPRAGAVRPEPAPLRP
jgi:CBS domain-containing protein